MAHLYSTTSFIPTNYNVPSVSRRRGAKDGHSVGGDSGVVEVHRWTPLGVQTVPALVGVHLDIQLRVPEKTSVLFPKAGTPAPLARARLVLCCHRIVKPEETSLQHPDYDRPTLTEPRSRLTGDIVAGEQLPGVVCLIYTRAAIRLTSLNWFRKHQQQPSMNMFY